MKTKDKIVITTFIGEAILIYYLSFYMHLITALILNILIDYAIFKIFCKK